MILLKLFYPSSGKPVHNAHLVAASAIVLNSYTVFKNKNIPLPQYPVPSRAAFPVQQLISGMEYKTVVQKQPADNL